MNFNTANLTFRQLLGNGLSYRVPPFQRDYSWTDDEWDDLWQDILGLFDEEAEQAHYMGYLVLQSADSKRFDIIDGQQRLTTLSVMVLSALSHLKELARLGLDAGKNERRREALQNAYIGYLDPVSLVPRSKLELNRHNNRFYQTYLVPLDTLPQRGLNASEHQLRKAFLWFRDKLKGYVGQKEDSGERLTAFIDALVDKLFFTVITVTDELNAFKVFETLNARGVRLSSTDLLKNYLFSIIHNTDFHETELRALEERWERIVGLLGSESFPEFLRVYWNSRYRLVRKSDLFKTIKKRINTRELAFELIRGLDQSAEVYAALRDPTDKRWEARERQALQQLLMFNVRQPLAMLLACYQRFAEHERTVFTRVLAAVSVISFRYNVICNLQTHDQERIYSEVAWKVSQQALSSLKDILAALAEIYPDDKTFQAAFSEKELRTTNTRNRKVVRYVLFEIEARLYQHELEFDSPLYNLEHILPEHPSDEWDGIEEARQERLIYRLGNMTPLEATPNRDIGNLGYASKQPIYAASDFEMTRKIIEHYPDWNETAIDSRQQQMAKVASQIWRIDFNQCKA
jgi:hypothetical protein